MLNKDELKAELIEGIKELLEQYQVYYDVQGDAIEVDDCDSMETLFTINIG